MTRKLSVVVTAIVIMLTVVVIIAVSIPSFLRARVSGLASYPAYAGRRVARADGNGPEQPANTERYGRIYENPFRDVRDAPVSTFAIDVDTASYSNGTLSGGVLSGRYDCSDPLGNDSGNWSAIRQ